MRSEAFSVLVVRMVSGWEYLMPHSNFYELYRNRYSQGKLDLKFKFRWDGGRRRVGNAGWKLGRELRRDDFTWARWSPVVALRLTWHVFNHLNGNTGSIWMRRPIITVLKISTVWLSANCQQQQQHSNHALSSSFKRNFFQQSYYLSQHQIATKNTIIF